MKRHEFTNNILTILSARYGDKIANDLLGKSLLLQYINNKSQSANRGSKSRGSFANLYAIYVILEDYIKNGYDKKDGYNVYEGAQFSLLMKRQRELPFGEKLQNHALNNRVNSEFQKYFPDDKISPILHNNETQRYWINETLLKIELNDTTYNIAQDIIDIIDEYKRVKQNSMAQFIQQCHELQNIDTEDIAKVVNFIKSLLAPNVDARLFEIVSYSILKHYYKGQSIVWGYNWDELNEEELKLFKTGRTNANDGGIDFVMKPIGRFFQVTETLDFKKYFLDIDKIEKYPITFVVKTQEDIDSLKKKLREDATKTYCITAVVDKYIACIEELINIPQLEKYFTELTDKGETMQVLDEIALQSKVEYNFEENEDEEETEEDQD